MNNLDPTQLFGAVDMVVMIAIAVIAIQLEASKRIGDGWATLVPLIIGSLWGVATAFTPQPPDAPQIPVFVLIIKGTIVNGGGASLAARLGKAGLDRLGITESSKPQQG